MMATKKDKDVKLTKAGKPRKKPGRKPAKNKKVYFGLDVQDAIVRYNQSEDDTERLYQEWLAQMGLQSPTYTPTGYGSV